MSFEQTAVGGGKDPKNLLLSVEEEVAARKGVENEYGELPFFESKYASSEGKILVVLGTRHTREEKDLSAIAERYRASRADAILHEGRPIQDLFPGMSDGDIRRIPPSEVSKRQEQAFLAWIAFCDGKPTLSWDLPLAEQLIAVSEHRGVEIVTDWLVVEALSKIYASKIPPTAGAFEALLGVVLQRDDRVPLERVGFDFSPDSIEAVCRKYFGYPLVTLAERSRDDRFREEDWSRCRGLSDPAYRGETNDVLREINLFRDRHAIEVIQDTKERFGSIFALGGGSHVRTWKPALAALYSGK